MCLLTTSPIGNTSASDVAVLNSPDVIITGGQKIVIYLSPNKNIAAEFSKKSNALDISMLSVGTSQDDPAYFDIAMSSQTQSRCRVDRF